MLPQSQRIAIVKLLPKIDNAITVDDFRPISLINTDLKILSHILADRFSQRLDEIIDKSQHAYLKGRQIHVALKKINKGVELLNKSRCLVALDFSKAFDKVDRKYMFSLVDKIGMDSFSVAAVKTLYNETVSVLEVNGVLSHPINVERGVRQGCPLSALLFILCIEPLLQKIKLSKHVKGFMSYKTVAYADDISCLVKRKSVEALFDIVSDFCDKTQLSINVNKSEILTSKKIPFYKSVTETKILGVMHRMLRCRNFSRVEMQKFQSKSKSS